MVYLTYIIIAFLILVIVMQQLKLNSSHKNMDYVSQKIEEVIRDQSEESIHVFTDDVHLQNFLSEVNQLLDMNRLNEAEKLRHQEAMRKMLSNISHDLKTPLTVINGYIETLMMSEHISLEEQDKLLNKVHEKSEDLINLINQFFDLAKLESEDQVITLAKVNISEVCRRVVLSYYEQMSDKNLEMKIEIPEKDYFIHGDQTSLIRCLNNLMNNAINYGFEGKILGIKVIEEEDMIKIEVWDQGKGIDEKFHNDVFERLYTLEDSRNRNYQGSGLGLTITKRLVEQMKGSIQLKSDPYIKTSFILNFHQLK